MLRVLSSQIPLAKHGNVVLFDIVEAGVARYGKIDLAVAVVLVVVNVI